MADNTKLGNLMGISMERIREMVDANTVIGEPVTAGDTTLIPVSKISFGFAAGGTDLPTKSPKETFGGGSGAGINITPVAFIAVTDGHVQVLPIAAKPDAGDKAINMVPELIDKVVDLFKKKKEDKADGKEGEEE